MGIHQISSFHLCKETHTLLLPPLHYPHQHPPTMRSYAVVSLVAALTISSVAAVPVVEKRNGMGPNPSVPGDGGNGLTVTVKDPMSNNSMASPSYRAISDFDYASFNLGLYQEWIELDLVNLMFCDRFSSYEVAMLTYCLLSSPAALPLQFNYGLKAFSDAEWEEAGVTADYRGLIQYFANQETGHAQLLTDILGPGAAKQCTYNYTGAFTDVRSYLNFNQQLTRWGESGVWGFLAMLNSRPIMQLLSQSIATEARQQMGFRQLTGSPAVDVFFEAGIPQSWAWTLLAPWIQSCPEENPLVRWSNYPALTVVNNPTLAYAGSKAAVQTNRTALTQPGDVIQFTWDAPGKTVGPDGQYITVKTGGDPRYAVFLQSYNATFVELTMTGERSATARVPSAVVFDTPIASSGPSINGTAFAAIVDEKMDLTPYNFTLITKRMVAGPAIFQAG